MIYTLPDESLFMWRIYTILIFILIAFICGIMLALFPILISVSTFFICLIIELLMFFWYLPRFCSSVKLNLSNDAVILTRGVFISHQYLMPCPRLIYVEQFTTPISYALGLKNLRLRAAKGRLTIYALSNDDTIKIIETLNFLRK